MFEWRLGVKKRVGPSYLDRWRQTDREWKGCAAVSIWTFTLPVSTFCCRLWDTCKLRLTQIPFFFFFFRCGGALKLQWEVVTHEASVHEGQKRSLAMMVFHSSSICHLASFLKLSPHIREVEPLPPPADGPPWDNELCQSIVPWITHTMFNNLKDIVWSVELVLFISSSQNWLTLLLYNIYSFYVWPRCTKLQFSDQKKSEICLQPVWSSLFDAHFFSATFLRPHWQRELAGSWKWRSMGKENNQMILFHAEPKHSWSLFETVVR